MKKKYFFLILLMVFVLPLNAQKNGKGISQYIALPPLPYGYDALKPYISENTLYYHYEKHHKGYVEKLNQLVENTRYAEKDLLTVIQMTGQSDETFEKDIFNNASQVWNHTFFWNSMKPGGGGEPEGKVIELIEKHFENWAAFKEAFIKTGLERFGSGYVWLTLLRDGTLQIVSSPDAVSPLVTGAVPLLACDIWEHAYYLDYQNQREKFLENFIEHLVDWDFVNTNLNRFISGINSRKTKE